MENFHMHLIKDDEKYELLLRCVQEHRRLHPDCKKVTFKRKLIKAY